MDCAEVRDRLVALQDDELSPGEAVQVTEHLDVCPDCAARERRLARATPASRLVVPPAALASLQDRVDVDVILALAEQRGSRAGEGPPGLRARLGPWLRRDARVPAVGLVAYAAVLALALGWGLANWWTLSGLRDGVQGPATAGEAIPAHQFAPAAYDPSGGTPPAANGVLDGAAPHLGLHAAPADPDADAGDGPSGEAEGGGFH